LVSRARSLDERQPVAAWPVARLRDDLDDVSITQLRSQRGHAPVDFRADATVPDLGVNGVSKVDRSSVAWQSDDLAFRGERIDFLGIEIDFQCAEEIRRILHLLLPLDEMAEPGDALIFAIVRYKFSILVFPVRGDALFCNPMHF